MDGCAAHLNGAEQLRHDTGRAAENGQNAQIFAQRTQLWAKRPAKLLAQGVQLLGAGLHGQQERRLLTGGLRGKRLQLPLRQHVGQDRAGFACLRADDAQHGKLPPAGKADGGRRVLHVDMRLHERAGHFCSRGRADEKAASDRDGGCRRGKCGQLCTGIFPDTVKKQRPKGKLLVAGTAKDALAV